MKRQAASFCAIFSSATTAVGCKTWRCSIALPAKNSIAQEEIRAEGWKWSEIAIDFPYGHTTGLRRLPGTQAPITEEEQARYDAAVAEYNRLSEEHEGADEISGGRGSTPGRTRGGDRVDRRASGNL